jgi:PHD/YefM family antitoxin component YafN of YafNO toxin-antitoxin module
VTSVSVLGWQLGAIASTTQVQYLKNIQVCNIMQSYSLREVRGLQDEVLEKATVEPILLTEESKPGYVIMSAQNYQQLLDKLTALEDRALGQLAETALKNSQMVGVETFTAELQRLASLDSSDL